MGVKNTPAVPPDAVALPRHPRLAAAHLRPGLFVADLDRPWLDTPFLLQGFVIDREDEIATLRAHCVHVYIDVALSDPGAVRAVREWMNAATDEPETGTRDETGPAASASDSAEPPEAAQEASLLRLSDDPEWQAEGAQASTPAAPDGPAVPDLMLVDEPAPVRAEPAPPPETTRAANGAPSEAVSRETRERFRRFVIENAGGEPAARRRPRGRWLRSLGGVVRAILTLDRRRLVAALAGKSDAPESAETELPPGSLAGGPPPKLSTHVDASLVDKVQVPTGEVLRTTERKLANDADAADIGDKDMARRHSRPLSASQAELDRELERILPPGASRVTYRERSTVAEELPRAQKALAQSARALETLMADVEQQREIPLETAREAVGDMVTSMLDNPDAMLWVAQIREAHMATYQHGVRVSLYMIAVGRSLGLPREMIEALGLIGILADVGKTRVPRALLDKPGMLTPVEFRIAKDHVRLGLKALEADMPLAPEVRAGIAEHHERLDGSGYPRGLKGAEISLWGRIAGIADCIAALITDRPYAKAMAAQDALMNLYQWADTSFHGPLVEQFVQSVGVFPVGSLVELSNGEVAIVLAHNRARRLEPRVIIVADAQKRPIAEPFERDLFKQAAVKGAKPLRIQRGLAAGAYGLKPQDFYADEALAHAQAA